MDREVIKADDIGAAASAKNRQLFASLYRDLRKLAESQLRRSHDASISPTTLLHEAYLGMSDREAVFPDRERFMGYAARVMRGLIIDFVRERRALKQRGLHARHRRGFGGFLRRHCAQRGDDPQRLFGAGARLGARGG